MVQPLVQWLLRFKASSLQSPGISNRVKESIWTQESPVPSFPYCSHWYFCPFCLPPKDLFLNIVKLIVAQFFLKRSDRIPQRQSLPSAGESTETVWIAAWTKGRDRRSQGAGTGPCSSDADWMRKLCELGTWHHHPHLWRFSPNSASNIRIQAN